MKEYYSDLSFDALMQKLSEIGLSVCWDVERDWVSVGKREIANPMLWFDPREEKADYSGSVEVKAINAYLFSKEQIHKSLELVNSFLLTELSKRDVPNKLEEAKM